ncbi:hypothetical protein Scep_029203 [Stephania cephalantha]|uniref:Uncharacterized protein n=1 Tax=Stephania cephalantha TaxID=152367 RepID=A0AAP0E0S8_9MAGN
MDKGKAPLQPEEFSTLNSFSPSPFSPLEDLCPLPTINEHEFSEFPDFPLRDTSHCQAQSDSANFDSDKHGYADGSNGDRITNYPPLPMVLDMGNTSSTLHGVKVGHEQIDLGDALMVNRAVKKGATYNRWKAMIDSLQVSRKGDQMEFNLPKRSKGPTFNVDELLLTDPEKARRLRNVAELEKQERELKAQTMELMLKLAFIKEEEKDMEALRRVLKLATETMEEKVKSQDETNFSLVEERRKLMTIVAAQEIIMKSQLSAMTKQIVSSSAHAMAPVVPPEQHMQLTQEHRQMLKQIEEELMEDDDAGNPTVPPNQFGGNADYGNPPEPPPSMW